MANRQGARLGCLFILTACTLLFGTSFISSAQEVAPPLATGEAEAQRTTWYKQAKFGMFIHWGPYSVASVEASWPIMTPEAHWNITEARYVALYKQFNPKQFDPQAWVSLAKDA
jgi:alpha-L-fucosidase